MCQCIGGRRDVAKHCNTLPPALLPSAKCRIITGGDEAGTTIHGKYNQIAGVITQLTTIHGKYNQTAGVITQLYVNLQRQEHKRCASVSSIASAKAPSPKPRDST